MTKPESDRKIATEKSCTKIELIPKSYKPIIQLECPTSTPNDARPLKKSRFSYLFFMGIYLLRIFFAGLPA
jgi:hypothetical protein